MPECCLTLRKYTYLVSKNNENNFFCSYLKIRPTFESPAYGLKIPLPSFCFAFDDDTLSLSPRPLLLP
jgi:hypothetical protein